MAKRLAGIVAVMWLSVSLLACNPGNQVGVPRLAAQGTACIVWTCTDEFDEAESITSLDTCPSDGDYADACENYFSAEQCYSDGGCSCDLSDEVTCDGSTCTFLPTDSQNCGACGFSCGAGYNCVNGQCKCLYSLCGETCVDQQNDAQNCGSCGHVCDSGFQCVGGQCCPSDKPNLCNGVCVNLQTDAKNCGSCGVQCNEPVTNQCSQGACICDNPQSITNCITNCKTTDYDLCLTYCQGEVCSSTDAQEACLEGYRTCVSSTCCCGWPNC